MVYVYEYVISIMWQIQGKLFLLSRDRMEINEHGWKLMGVIFKAAMWAYVSIF